ncbi:L-threonylcarbamoyladenylate synthase [Fastidiosibacter lacustris]|uniref:L-threonylcarbamoyladenylate synthase n=1 Tax=Fastidiosibacter lacustris TaxID=2056695 RepID=UPI000E342CB2|nr:L-threonylcarbamoyladenylate synthase [Fastidiosibacter lacustris]
MLKIARINFKKCVLSLPRPYLLPARPTPFTLDFICILIIRIINVSIDEPKWQIWKKHMGTEKFYKTLAQIAVMLKNGKVLGLPTESVYGLSCIIQKAAVEKVIALKQRDLKKGFIVLSGDISHLLALIDTEKLNEKQLEILSQRQDKPTTWVVPVKHEYRWLTGDFGTIAVRLTDHPLLKELTITLGCAIISTSANLSNQPPATSYDKVQHYFGDQLDYIHPQQNFIAAKPSRVINLISNEVLRD